MKKNNSGRFSPIESPKRKYKENEEIIYSNSNILNTSTSSNLPSPPSSPSPSLSSPAPSYTSNITKNTNNSLHSHHSYTSSKSTYSNLMNYLNEITENNNKIPERNTSQGNSHNYNNNNDNNNYNNNNDNNDNDNNIVDEMSTISNSISSIPKNKSISSRQYIWDEDNNHSNILSSTPSYHLSQQQYSHYQSLFKPSLNSNNSNKQYMNESSPSSSSSASISSKTNSLKSNFDEVKRKVDVMKGELKIKNQAIKELQSELSRIATIRDKKAEKLSINWNQKLVSIKEKNHEALKKLSNFYTKISDDIQKVTNKCNELKEKIEKQPEIQQLNFQEFESNCIRDRKRNLKQLENEEKQLFEKIAASKNESMQKYAADTIGPKLEQIVIDGREKINKLREEGEKRILRRVNELRKDLQNQYEIRYNELLSKTDIGETNASTLRERRIQQTLQRHNDEIKALKEKFGQDMNLADESIDRIRTIHSNTHVNQLHLLKKTEQDMIQQLKVKNQQELDGVIQIHTRELEKIRNELEQQFTEWKRDYQSEIESNRVSRESEIKDRVKREIIQDIEILKQRLREDVIKERSDFKKSYENNLKEERIRIESQLESFHTLSERLEDNCNKLRKEVENLRLRVYTIRGEVTDKKEEFDDEIKQLRLTDLNLDNQSQSNLSILQQTEKILDDKFLQKQLNYENKINEMRLILDNEQKRKEKEENERTKHIQDRQSEMINEVSRINVKINTLLKTRENELIELQKSLNDLREKNHDLEEQLDEDRGKSIRSDSRKSDKSK